MNVCLSSAVLRPKLEQAGGVERTRQLGDREQGIRDIAYRLWDQAGRPSGQADRHWRKAREIWDAQNPDLVAKAPPLPLLLSSEQPMETGMRNFDEIVADAQKAVALSLREAFDAGRAHTAFELKRRMAVLFEGLVSGEVAAHGDPTHPPAPHEGQHSDHGG